MATILVISLSDLGSDPRVDRQIDFLRGSHRVIAAGFGPPAYDDVEYVELDEIRPRYATMLIKLGLIQAERLLGLHRRAYWSQPNPPHWRELLVGLGPDLTLVNDAAALPLAFAVSGDAPVVFDAHEYSLSEYETSWRWRLFGRGQVRWICREFLTRVSGMMAVSDGIASKYEGDTGVAGVVVTNAPRFEPLEPTDIGDPVRLVHFGVADPQRRLEDTLAAVRSLDGGYTLDLLLVTPEPFQRHREELERLVAGDRRVRFLEPVPMRELPRFANRYDIGVFLLPPQHVNQEFVLPNKFFEYIQARIVPAIGPSPEMARIVREWDCGIVAEDFTPEALAAVIAGTSKERLAELKRNADAAARQLCAERNREIVVDVVEKALETGRG